jgi:hypothetical protein
MLDREGVQRIDREGVQRILAAVNLPLVPVSEPDPWGDPLPSPEDRLLADLEGWQSIYHTGEMQRWRPADREKLARRIMAAFERGNALLDEYIKIYGARHLLPYRKRLDDLRRDLGDSPWLNKLTGFKQQVTLSNFENAVGGLHHIFVRHFGVDRKYTVDPYAGGTITGLFITFAEAVLKEAGLVDEDGATYTSRYIANALVKLSKLKS